MDVMWISEVYGLLLAINLVKDREKLSRVEYGQNDLCRIIINVNHATVQVAKDSNDALQALILHEIRHVWQWRTGEWIEDATNKNVSIERDAFDTQCDFERKIGISIMDTMS